MIIVEFFGGPGSGKTTTATRVFSEFKQLGFDCEFTREYAQEAIYTQQRYQLDSQFIVAANQYRKYKELELAGTELVFSDTSLLLSKVYGVNHPSNHLLAPLVDALHREFTVIKVFVRRCKPFRPQGRVHTEAQSREIDILIRHKLGPFDYEIDGTEQGIQELVDKLRLAWAKPYECETEWEL